MSYHVETTLCHHILNDIRYIVAALVTCIKVCGMYRRLTDVVICSNQELFCGWIRKPVHEYMNC